MPERSANSSSEAAQVERARGGDAEAFEALVRRHFADVYALLFRMIGNHEDAEDLAQECFLKAQSSLGHFRGEASFATWLYRIALHQSRDHFRRRSRAPQLLPLAQEPSPATRHAGPFDESSRRELGAALRRGLDALPHKLRAALVLRTQEGMEYDEIARVLECAPQTARVHVLKARRQLSTWLERWRAGGHAR